MITTCECGQKFRTYVPGKECLFSDGNIEPQLSMTSVRNHKIKYRINLYCTNEEKNFEIFQTAILDV